MEDSYYFQHVFSASLLFKFPNMVQNYSVFKIFQLFVSRKIYNLFSMLRETSDYLRMLKSKRKDQSTTVTRNLRNLLITSQYIASCSYIRHCSLPSYGMYPRLTFRPSTNRFKIFPKYHRSSRRPCCMCVCATCSTPTLIPGRTGSRRLPVIFSFVCDEKQNLGTFYCAVCRRELISLVKGALRETVTAFNSPKLIKT